MIVIQVATLAAGATIESCALSAVQCSEVMSNVVVKYFCQRSSSSQQSVVSRESTPRNLSRIIAAVFKLLIITAVENFSCCWNGRNN